MAEWLRNFDRLSFWLGFLTAGLLGLMVKLLAPVVTDVLERIRRGALGRRDAQSANDEVRLTNDMLRLVQHWHLAASLFSLDEVLVTPRLLAPAALPDAYEPPPSRDITDRIIPEMLDWPEMASTYGAPWLTLLEALHGGANLAIVGQPGSGKTVALASLACDLIRSPTSGNVADKPVPLPVHIGAILGSEAAGRSALDQLIAAVTSRLETLPAYRLAGLLHELLARDRLVLILDGLDELPPQQLEQAVAWLNELFGACPRLRAVVTADPGNLGRLPQLGFVPIALASWTIDQRAAFISRWSEQWKHLIAPEAGPNSPRVDPLLVIGWLVNTTANLTPLELTLKTWAALAGDALGPRPTDAIESYLRRILVGQPSRNRSAVEQLAAQSILSRQAVMDASNIENWQRGEDQTPIEAPLQNSDHSRDNKGRTTANVTARGALPDLVDTGLLIAHCGERFSWQNPIFAGYLAAGCLQALNAGGQIARLAPGSMTTAAQTHLALLDPQSAWLMESLSVDETDLLQQRLLEAARRLRLAPDNLAWVTPTLRKIAAVLQSDDTPLGLKLRLAAALALSANPGAFTLLHRLSIAPSAEMRRLSALGMGMLRDPQAAPDLLRLIKEPIPQIYQAAILALVALGGRAGLEAIADQLVSGDEERSRAAAEGLANHPEEGYPTLEEASRMEDPGVRRAAVFGLARVRRPWAEQILANLHTEDRQWAVQDAAEQALRWSGANHPRLPQPLPALTHTPWLIAFAAERGIGVAPGKPANELVYQALQAGSAEQISAAIYYLKLRGDAEAVLPLYNTYFADRGEFREQAFEALMRLAAAGVALPQPAQFGLH